MTTHRDVTIHFLTKRLQNLLLICIANVLDLKKNSPWPYFMLTQWTQALLMLHQEQQDQLRYDRRDARGPGLPDL